MSINSQLRVKWRTLGLSVDDVQRLARLPYFYANKFKPAKRSAIITMGTTAGCAGTEFTAGLTIQVVLTFASPFVEAAVLATAVVKKTGSTNGAEIALADGLTRAQVVAQIAIWFAQNQYLAQFARVLSTTATGITFVNEYNDEFGFNIAGTSANNLPTGTMIGANKLATPTLDVAGTDYTPGFVFVGPTVKRLFAPVTYYPPPVYV